MAYSSFNNVHVPPNFHQVHANYGSGNPGVVEPNFYNQPGPGQAAAGSNSSFSTQHSTPFDIASLDPATVYLVLSSANDQALLGSGNAAYRQLYNQNIRLEFELKLEKNRRPEQISASVPSIPPALSTTTSAPTTTPSGLVIPPSPPALDRDEYLKADECWWEKELWVNHINREKSKGRIPKKLAFLTDALGVPVSKDRLAIISKTARHLWVTLYQFRQDPGHWGTKSKDAADYFSNSMRLQYPEFQLCDGDWKTEAFATLRYPDWKGNRDVGTLRRNVPSITSTLKRKNPSSSKETQTKKPKKMSAPQPIDVDAMEDDPDIQVVGNGITLTTPPPSTSPLTTTSQTLPSTSTPPPQSTSANISTTPRPPTESSSLITQDQSTTSQPPAPADLPPPPSTPLSATPPSLSKDCDDSSSKGASPPTNPSSEMLASVPTQTTPAPTPGDQSTLPPTDQLAPSLAETSLPDGQSGVAGRGRPRRKGVNVLQSISIPKPAATVIAPATNTSSTAPQAAPATATVVLPNTTVAKGRGKKNDGALKDNGTTSARNLYAIDYLAEHGETSANDFKLVWDNLAAETLKEYKLKSAAAKKKN